MKPSLGRWIEVEAGLRAHLALLKPADVVVKESSSLHRAIARGFGFVHQGAEILAFLSVAAPRVPTSQEYLSRYTTTIGTTIAMPEDLHRPERAMERLLTLPHEWAHVDQHLRGVDAGWWPESVSHSVLYLCSVATDDAAEYLGKVEADAYAVSEAMRLWAYGALTPLDAIVEALTRHYALRPAGATLAAAILRSHYATLEDDGIPNVWAAREAWGWLAANAPDTRAPLGGWPAP